MHPAERIAFRRGSIAGGNPHHGRGPRRAGCHDDACAGQPVYPVPEFADGSLGQQAVESGIFHLPRPPPPGQQENWSVKVSGPAGKDVAVPAAELLAYMYDRSLDCFCSAFAGQSFGICIPTGAALSRPEPIWVRRILFGSIANGFNQRTSSANSQPQINCSFTTDTASAAWAGGCKDGGREYGGNGVLMLRSAAGRMMQPSGDACGSPARRNAGGNSRSPHESERMEAKERNADTRQARRTAQRISAKPLSGSRICSPARTDR